MDNAIALYNGIRERTIIFIEKRRRYIPLSGLIISYLRAPLLARILITLVFTSSVVSIIYNIGFVILQSKARNETLSFITAYHNSIDFPKILNYYYAFLYIILLLPSSVSLFIPYFCEKLVFKKSVSKVRILCFVLSLFLFIIILSIVYVKVTSFIAYVMLYQSRHSGIFEMLIKYILHHDQDIKQALILSMDYFSKEVFESLQLGNIVLFFLVYLIYFLKKYIKSAVKYIFLTLAGLSLILILITHTLFQWGSFGKSLARFDIDFVSIEYSINNNLIRLKGVEVYRGENVVIIRDYNNVLHTIRSDQYHIQTEPLEQSQ